MPRNWGDRAGRRGRAGARRTLANDGEFYCGACGGDRGFRTLTVRRFLRIGRVPLLPGRRGAPEVECGDCQTRFGAEVLDVPTCRRLLVMLAEADRTLALAALSAGGSADPAVREAACAAVRRAGNADCTAARLLAALAAFDGAAAAGGDGGGGSGGDDGGDVEQGHRQRVDGCSPGLAVELHAVLGPLGPHLEGPGRARLLSTAAHIALADGPYTPNERTMLVAAGRALTMRDPVIQQVLKEATRA